MSEQVFKRLYSVREAARYLRSQPSRRYGTSMVQQAARVCGRARRVLFDIYDMDRFIENNKREGRHGHDLSTQETRPDDGDFGRTGPIVDEK